MTPRQEQRRVYEEMEAVAYGYGASIEEHGEDYRAHAGYAPATCEPKRVPAVFPADHHIDRV